MVILIYGTRPEKIKLAPVAEALGERDTPWRWHYTGQGSGLIEEPREWTGSLREEMARSLSHNFAGARLVVVQGDTASAFASALSAWLSGVPVAHVEAGLRTYEREPYPEEGFRGMIARMATLHFAPSDLAAAHLERELGSPRGIYVTGNPGIDALKRRAPGAAGRLRILATLHRRENWGGGIDAALRVLASADADVTVVEHPNWSVALAQPKPPGLRYMGPTDYPTFVAMLEGVHAVVTDSGGLQEECAALGMPCIVYRRVTERVELERLGAVRLTPNAEALARELRRLTESRSVYGRGDAAGKIAERIGRFLGEEDHG